MIATQSILFVKFFISGLIFGLAVGAFKLLKTFFSNRFFIIIVDFITCIMFTFTYIYLINKLNLGKSRLYLVLSILLGVILERITLGKIFAKIYFKLYNSSKVLKGKLIKSKLGKIIFK